MWLIWTVLVAVVVIGGLYWYLHKKNPTATQQVIDSAKSGLQKDISSLANSAADAAKNEAKKL